MLNQQPTHVYTVTPTCLDREISVHSVGEREGRGHEINKPMKHQNDEIRSHTILILFPENSLEMHLVICDHPRGNQV